METKLNKNHWSTLTKHDVYNIGRFQYLINFYHRAYSDYRVNREVCHIHDLFEKECFTEKELCEAYKKDVENIRNSVKDIVDTYCLNVRL